MTVFIHSNGEVLCQQHLGVTASKTGRDIDGGTIMKADSKEIGIECETCRGCRS